MDRRVRKRLRTGSGGTSRSGKIGQDRARPGKAGQSRASRRIDGSLCKLPVQILRVFRPELAHCLGENASRVHKKVPGDTRGLARQNWHTGADIFLPPSIWGPFCQGFRLWTLQTIGTLVGTFVTNRQKSLKIDEIGENH